MNGEAHPQSPWRLCGRRNSGCVENLALLELAHTGDQHEHARSLGIIPPPTLLAAADDMLIAIYSPRSRLVTRSGHSSQLTPGKETNPEKDWMFREHPAVRVGAKQSRGTF